MNNSRYERLSGISVSLPTFTDQGYNLELGKAQKQIRWLINQGLTEENCVVFTAGGLGEGLRAVGEAALQAHDGR